MEKLSLQPGAETAESRLAELAPVAEAIATLFNPQAEVVIHDLASGQIAYIANNISRRQVGDPSLNDLQDIGDLDEDVIGPYGKTNFDGRSLKSVTAVLRNQQQQPYGLMCINFDIALFESARTILSALTSLHTIGQQPPALFRADWQESVNKAIAEHLKNKGLAMSALAKQDHAEIIATLDRDGFLAIRNVVPYLANLFGISRATVYKHLKKARSHSGLSE